MHKRQKIMYLGRRIGAKMIVAKVGVEGSIPFAAPIFQALSWLTKTGGVLLKSDCTIQTTFKAAASDRLFLNKSEISVFNSCSASTNSFGDHEVRI
jgi:hypothetical protein